MKRFCWTTFLFLSLLFVFGFWGFVWRVAALSPLPDEAVSHLPADTAVVLTGGPSRIRAGLALLHGGKIKTLFISGVNKELTLHKFQETYKVSPEFLSSVFLGYSADNTAQNAVEVAAWVKERGLHEFILITSGYHMPRSALEIRELLPRVKMVLYPIRTEPFEGRNWWWNKKALGVLFLEYVKYIFAMLRHVFV